MGALIFLFLIIFFFSVQNGFTKKKKIEWGEGGHIVLKDKGGPSTAYCKLNFFVLMEEQVTKYKTKDPLNGQGNEQEQRGGNMHHRGLGRNKREGDKGPLFVER
jgi:hypothetical protein